VSQQWSIAGITAAAADTKTAAAAGDNKMAVKGVAFTRVKKTVAIAASLLATSYKLSTQQRLQKLALCLITSTSGHSTTTIEHGPIVFFQVSVSHHTMHT
jgi:hypothetical protein